MNDCVMATNVVALSLFKRVQLLGAKEVATESGRLSRIEVSGNLPLEEQTVVFS